MTEALGREELPLLWYFPISYATIKARLALEEKGIKYCLRSINILTGASVTPEYAKVNPNFTVPSLQLKDRILTDSTDILRWADSAGEPLGGTSVDREKVEEFIKLQEQWDDTLYTLVHGRKSDADLLNSFRTKVAEARFNKYGSTEQGPLFQKRLESVKRFNDKFADPAKAEENEKHLSAILDLAQSQLTSAQFAAGSEFSMADVELMTVLARLDMAGTSKNVLKDRAELAAYWERMKARESYKTAVGQYQGLASVPILVPTLGSIIMRNLLKLY